MKIIHVGSRQGGAGKGMINLHEGLVSAGVDSNLINAKGACKEPEKTIPESLHKKIIRRIIKIICNRWHELFVPYKGAKGELFSTNLCSDGTYQKILKEKPDIVHLHWINDGSLSLKEVGLLKVPIVWTLRDCWPFTGGCHYYGDCRRYMSSCGKCPVLDSSCENDGSNKILGFKKKYWNKNSIHPVGISEWVSNECKKSDLFCAEHVSTIWNCVNAIYCDNKITTQKKRLTEIDRGNLKVGFGALDPVNDDRKGFKYFVETINAFQSKTKLKVEVHIFGDKESDMINIPNCKVVRYGLIDKIGNLCQFYQKIHVFMAPSLEETFCKTAAEALTQGTPVLAFNYSGLRDVVDHKVNGYLAKYKDIEDLEKGLTHLTEKSVWKRFSDLGVVYSRVKFHPNAAVDSYLSLYKRILNDDLT